MANKKNKDDLEDDFPEIGDSSSDESVSLDAFPDSIDFPEPDDGPDFGDGGGAEGNPAEDDFGDLEDSFPDGEAEEETAATPPSDTDDDDWGDAEASYDADGGEGDEDDGYDDTHADADFGDDDDEDNGDGKLGLVDKLKQQAIPLGAGVVLLGFVSYIAMNMFFPSGPANTGGGYAPPPQAMAPPAQAPSAPPAGPAGDGGAPQGAETAVAPPGMPTGPAPGGDVPAPPQMAENPAGPAGADFPPPQMPGDPVVGTPGDMQLPGGQMQDDDLFIQHDMAGPEDSIPLYVEEDPGPAMAGIHPEVEGPQGNDLVPVNGLSEMIASSMEEVVGHRFNEVLDRMDDFSADLSDLSLSLNRVDGRINDLDFEIAEVRENVRTVDSRVEEYIERVEELEFRLDNLEINRRVITSDPAEDHEGDVTVAVVLPALPAEGPGQVPAGDEEDAPEDPPVETAETTSEPEPPAQVASKPAEPKPQQKAAPAKQKAPQRAAAPAPSRPAIGGSLTPPGKPLVVDGYYLKGVSRGLAWIDTGRGIIRAGVGQEIEGIGRIRRITQGQGDWMVVTDAGLILP